MKTNEAENEHRWARLRSPRSWTADDAKWVLDEQAESGRSVADFAKQRGLQVKRLYAWRVRLNCQRALKPTRGRPVALVPVTVRPMSATGDYAVVVSTGGVRIEVRELNVTSRSWVAELLGLEREP